MKSNYSYLLESNQDEIILYQKIDNLPKIIGSSKNIIISIKPTISLHNSRPHIIGEPQISFILEGIETFNNELPTSRFNLTYNSFQLDLSSNIPIPINNILGRYELVMSKLTDTNNINKIEGYAEVITFISETTKEFKQRIK